MLPVYRYLTIFAQCTKNHELKLRSLVVFFLVTEGDLRLFTPKIYCNSNILLDTIHFFSFKNKSNITAQMGTSFTRRLPVGYTMIVYIFNF